MRRWLPFIAILLTVGLWPAFTLAQTANGCCRPSTGQACIENAAAGTCPSPNAFYESQTCASVPECSTQQPTPTGCCRPSTGQACIADSAVGTCPTPNFFYPGQTCASVPACANPTPIASTGCCVAAIGSTCSNNATITTCPAPNVLYPGTQCSEIPVCPKGSGDTGAPSPTSTLEAPIKFYPEIAIPGFTGGTVTGTTLGEYIRAVFVWFIWTIGILATIMITYGGIRWVVATGNSGRIGDAKDIINNAIIGLIIALTSYVLLNTISPQLVSFNGLTTGKIIPEVAKFYQDIIEATGPINKCQGTIELKGDPTTACSSQGCADTLNAWIANATRQYKYSEAHLIKAIIQTESPKKRDQPNRGVPFSGPTQIDENKDGIPDSTAYGIGQMLSDTLYEVLNKARPGIPSECPTKREPHEPLTVECKEWLDLLDDGFNKPQGLSMQVHMTTYYLRQSGQANCVKGDLAKTAAAYFMGGGGVANFCNPELIKNAKQQKTYENAIDYVSKVKANYQKACSDSGGTN